MGAILDLPCPSVILRFFHSVTFQIKIFCHIFLRMSGVEDWNLVHTWTVDRCIMSTRIRLLLPIHPFISSLFFLSNFQTLKFFVTLSSGTVRPRRLKFCTHMDSGKMYPVYRNQAAAAYLSLYFFIFSSPEQSSRRATVLPPALALALALALELVSTNVKVLC